MYTRIDFILLFVLLLNTASGDPIFKDYMFSRGLNASYKFYEMKLNFTDAAAFCMREGAYLLIPTSNYELKFLSEYDKITYFVGPNYDYFWIGVNNVADSKHFLPIDDTDLMKMKLNWSADHPKYEANNCAYFRLKHSIAHSVQCSYLHRFICKRSWGNPDFKEIEKPDFRNDYHYDIQLKNFYKWYEPLKFSDASSECMDDGAIMLIPQSLYEIDLGLIFANKEIYLGIHEMNNDGDYETIDGSDRSKVHMLSKRTKIESNNCFSYTFNSLYYEYVNCLDAKRFVCKISSNDIEWDNDCKTYVPDFHYNNRTGRCYKYYSTPKDWHSAKKRCESHNATLLVVNDKKEAEFLENIFLDIIPGYIQSFHSGFEKYNFGRFRTVDGLQFSDIKYNKWIPENEQHLNDSSKCGLIDRSLRMKYHDCTNKLGYICEKSTSKGIIY